MRAVVSISYRIVASLVIVAILGPNLALYDSRLNRATAVGTRPDAQAQLRFLRAALQDGAGERMQRLFPEGYFFSYVLYGLAWVEIGLREPDDSNLHRQAVAEAAWALDHLDTEAGRSSFAPSLDPPYGVFYVGWSSWLRGGLLKLQGVEWSDPAMIARFEADGTALQAAFERSASPFLAAYPGQAWPVDSVVAMAALSLHDSLLPSRFHATRERWLTSAKTLLDPTTGLLPHRVDYVSGQALETARGSSQSIISRFLIEIDPQWGREQYALFRQQFITTRLSLLGVREYPLGDEGVGDVDPGPLVLGFSASASVVTIGGALVHGDHTIAHRLGDAAEAIGLPVGWRGTKRYAFGQLPVGDVFFLWARSAQPWVAPPVAEAWEPPRDWWWRMPFHGLSIISIALVLAPAILHWRGRQHKRAE